MEQIMQISNILCEFNIIMVTFPAFDEGIPQKLQIESVD